ncbi:holo-[acyl-carrier-protein] synthase [Streptomyces cyaneochromogenes]|uniref:Holo-[acyl-carrier-protein] synthase n=1 Tax=Streptomyces cyaneochromogenes TaxID=2496836 RepID=A0A3Q9EYH6_9ACTN|nr:holo-ACP synthase [Streptomyces cyaneochromogenes]AZQ38779.1 holo-[acyl-carrier-protein] synthase [Streptomyces cyaneochromogenes]
MRIGIDVLELGELDRLQERSWFRRYTYTADELALAASFGPEREREFLAGRFAAKEAVLKVLGTGFGSGLAPRHISVVRDTRAAPLVRLADVAARRAAGIGVSDLALSIAHKGEYVVAVALGRESGGEEADGERDGTVTGMARAVLDEIAAREMSRNEQAE